MITARVADPPLAPSLTSPTNGAYLDSNAAGVTFSWAYNPGTDSGTQTAYALRVSTDGGAYQYWNATSSAFQSGIVWNSLTTGSVAIPAGKLADGHSYTWSIATQESHYGLQGPFASDLQFTGNAMPTATITAPSGTISSPTPLVTWSEVLGSGDVQTAFRVVIYTLAVTGQAGFSPGVTTPTVDSGVVSSAATSWQVPSGSALGQAQWVVYVQITETGAINSTWSSSSFTVAFDPPAAPSLSAALGTSGAGVPIITLTATAHDNLLSYNDASFEGGIGDWTPGANATLAQSTAQALDGTDSMSITAAATAGPFTLSPSTSGQFAVNTGQQHQAMASLRANSTGRSWTLGIQWKNSSGAVLSTTTGSAVTDTTTGWTQVTVAGTAPANAVKADLILTGTAIANSEVHYVDKVGLFQASSLPAWSRGGLIGIELMSFQRSVDGGTTWTAIRNGTNVAVPTNTEQVQVVDYEAPFNSSVLYQATVSANVTAPTSGTITSSGTQATVTTPAEHWFITDPLDTSISLSPNRVRLTMGSMPTNMQIPMTVEFDSVEQMGVFYGWNNPTPIIQRGTMQAKTFTVAFYLVGAAAHATWEKLTGRDGSVPPRQHTLQMRDDMGNSWYVVIGPQLADQLLRTSDRLTNPQWVVVATCIVTSAP